MLIDCLLSISPVRTPCLRWFLSHSKVTNPSKATRLPFELKAFYRVRLVIVYHGPEVI